MADSTLSNLTSLTLPSQATDLLLVGRGTARPNKVAMSDALNSAALAATTSTYGVVQLAASGGTTAGTVVQATDARLSDTRNPPDGSKGDIVVSGSGSTWTIKTNPTLSGNVTATGKITATGTTGFPYEGQLIASNSSPSGTNSAVSQAILQAQPGYQTYVGVTGDGTTASYRTGGLGNVVLFSQSYLVGDGANGMLLHSINGPTIFATQNTGSEKMRLASNGNLLLGTTTDSSNGRLQLATHTASTGGIGFGTDVVLYRQAADVLKTDDCFVVSGTGVPTTTHGLELQHNGTTGYVFSYNRGTSTPLAIAINHTGGNVELAASGSHQVLVKGTGVSNSTSSGALVVSGGLGVAGAAFFGGNIQCNAVFAANNTTLYLRPQGATISAGQAQLSTTGDLTLSGTIVDPAITGTILEDIFTITDAAAFEVDPGNGSIQLITLGASRTPKATNFAAGESITLMVNDGTAYTLTWTDATWGTGGVAWVGGSAPTLATTGYTVIQFWKVGTQIYGARVGDVA